MKTEETLRRTKCSAICRTTAKEKNPSFSSHIPTRQVSGGFDFQSRRFLAHAQTYDD
jgi:hypothetical protein